MVIKNEKVPFLEGLFCFKKGETMYYITHFYTLLSINWKSIWGAARGTFVGRDIYETTNKITSAFFHPKSTAFKMVKNMASPIVDDVFGGYISNLYNIVALTLYHLVNVSFIQNFSPNFNLFRDYFSSSEQFTQNMFSFLRYGGFVIGVGIFIVSFITIAVGYVVESKDNFYQLIIRLLLTCGLILISPGLCEMGCKTAGAAYSIATKIVTDSIGSNQDDFANDITNGVLNAADGIVPIDESADLDIDLSSNAATVFLQALLIIGVCIEFFKCVIEIIKRYVLSNLLWLFSPVVAGTFASSTTQPIFFAYFRMFNSQLILLILNVLFIDGFIMMIANRESYTVLHLFVAIAWLQIANSVERFLSSIGMNAVATGGTLLDTVNGSLRTMMMAGKAAGRIKDGAAKGLVSIGTKTGDMGTVSAGLALGGKGSGAGSTLAAAIQHAGSGGLKYNNSLANNIAKAHKAGQYSIVSSTIGQIQDPEQRKAAIKNLLASTLGNDGSGKLPAGISESNMHKLQYNPNGSISWSSSLDMGDGKMKEANFRIDSNGSGRSVLSFEDSDGNTKFLHSDGIDGGLDIGDRISFSNTEDGLSTLEAIGGIPINNLGDEEKSVISDQLDAGEYLGNNEWSLLDKNGERIASFNGTNGEFHLRGDSENVTPESFQKSILKDEDDNIIQTQGLGEHLGYRNVQITGTSKDGFKFTAEEYNPRTGEYESKKEYVATNLVTHAAQNVRGLKKLDLGKDGYYGIVPQKVPQENQKKKDSV